MKLLLRDIHDKIYNVKIEGLGIRFGGHVIFPARCRYNRLSSVVQIVDKLFSAQTQSSVIRYREPNVLVSCFSAVIKETEDADMFRP